MDMECVLVWQASFLPKGEKGHRHILQDTVVMIHQPLGGAKGQASDIKIQAEWMQKTKEKLNKILSEATGQPYETILRDTDRDNFMSASEAVEYGLVDKVLSREELSR